MGTFGFFWLRFRRVYDSAYDSDLWFSPRHKPSYVSDYDSDSDFVASANQPLAKDYIWQDDSPGLASNVDFRTHCSSCASLAIFKRGLWPTKRRKQALVSRQMPPNTHCPSMKRPLWYFFLPKLHMSLSKVVLRPPIGPSYCFMIVSAKTSWH